MQKIAPAVENAPAVMTKDELFAPAQRLVDGTIDPTRRKALETALEARREDYADSDVWSLKLAQALKRDLDTFTPAKTFRGQDVASEVRTLQHAMADAIRQKTYASLDDVNIKKDYLDWANLDELQKVGVKAITDTKLKGGAGTLVGGMWDMLTVPVKTVGGRVFGASQTNLSGRVSNIRRPSDVAGVYGAAGAGAAVGSGVRAIVLRNEKGAVLELSGRQTGLMLNADLSGLAISLR